MLDFPLHKPTTESHFRVRPSPSDLSMNVGITPLKRTKLFGLGSADCVDKVGIQTGSGSDAACLLKLGLW
jgi:hypothetical protein